MRYQTRYARRLARGRLSASRAPMQEVVSREFDRNGVAHDLMACGHTITPERSMYGYASPTRHMCPACPPKPAYDPYQDARGASAP